MNRPDLAQSQRDALFRTAVLCLFAIGLAAVLQPALWPTARQRSLRDCVAAYLGREAAALPLAEAHRKQYPEDLLATALAAETYGRTFDPIRSIELFEQLPRDGGRWELARQLGTARRYVTLGWLDEAERSVRGALALDPFHTDANSLLGKILLWEGRAWEAVEPEFRALLRGRCRGDELIGVAAAERFFPANQDLNLNIAKAPEKSVAMEVAAARVLAFDGRTVDTERLLRRVVRERPELGEAQGRLGRIIVDRGDPAEFRQWMDGLPEEARSHPEVLFALGLMARRVGQTEGAVHCFLQAIERSPNHLGTSTQLSVCFDQLGRSAEAKGFARRAAVLSDLETKLNLIRDTVTGPRIVEIANLLGEIGRYWEAAGWNFVLVQTELTAPRAQDDMHHWLQLARREDSPTPHPAAHLRSGDFAPPRWENFFGRPSSPEPGIPPGAGGASDDRRWSFVEEAASRGIDFRYFEGTTEANRLTHIFNVVGGGLAAVDYDQDGWPDLYLAQANDWRNPLDDERYSDRLYRNQEGRRFAECSAAAGLSDRDFSHGVTAGDVDQDGFADLYISNLGPNRLLRNLGDGTFEDETAEAGVAGNEWSTSSVLADLSGDGLPDLYVLNYTEAEATRRTICHRNDRSEMGCTPDYLPAEFDRLYLNEGNGHFRDVSAESGVRQPDGRGFGVVAWDFDGHGRLGLFVGNDTTENFLFINRASAGASVPSFVDEAVVRGCAYDVDGNSQASMGVAAGDVTGDGAIDLFITNFFADSNTLYTQSPDGSFEDQTREANLREPSFWMLGFGCQFGDFDCDGWDDVVVANGHIDQLTSRGGPDRMRPQLFHNQKGHNQKGRTFAEVPAERLGPFFESTYLGRGLATFDWNRDGRTDVGISHLHGSFALLTNQTAAAFRPLSVRLIGRRGCRDPIGSSVTVRAAGREMTRLHTGGDGFLVTNERRLLFAVPSDAGGLELTVRWFGGTVETFSLGPESRDLAVLEGSGTTFVLRDFLSLSGDATPN